MNNLTPSVRYKKIHDDLVKQLVDEVEQWAQKEENYRMQEFLRDPIYVKNLEEKNEEKRAQVNNNLYYLYFIKPVSPRFFAWFQYHHLDSPTFVDEVLYEILKKEKCTICWDRFVLYDRYATWPCSSTPPHHFHFKCITKAFRKTKDCPLCRKPATFENF